MKLNAHNVVVINRNEGVPESPAPFFANEKPTWTAVVNRVETERIIKMTKNPSKKFMDEIKSVFVNGEPIFGTDATDSDPYSK